MCRVIDVCCLKILERPTTPLESKQQRLTNIYIGWSNATRITPDEDVDHRDLFLPTHHAGIHTDGIICQRQRWSCRTQCKRNGDENCDEEC